MRGQDFRSAAFKGLHAHEILGNALSATQQEVRVRSASNKDVLSRSENIKGLQN